MATLYLFGNGQVSEQTSSENNVNLPENTYTHAMLSSTQSLYVLHDQIDAKANSRSQILEGNQVTPLDFVVRSFTGFPKEGLILFRHPDFNGKGKAYSDTTGDITGDFPVNQNAGASAMIVRSGQWELYAQKDQGGFALPIEGQTLFGLGQYPSMGPNSPQGAGDRVQSIKRVIGL